MGDVVGSLMGVMASVDELVTPWHRWRSGRQECGGGCGMLNALVAAWLGMVMVILTGMLVVLLVVADLVVEVRVQTALARLGRDH